MSKQLLVTVLAVLALLLAYVFLTDEPPQRAPAASWEFPEIEAFDRLELERGELRLVVEKRNGEWLILEPVNYLADESVLRRIEQAIADPDSRIRIDDETEVSPSQLTRHGFDEDTLHVTLFDEGVAVAAFTIGAIQEARSGAPRTWIRPDDSDQLFRLTADLRLPLDNNLNDWRNEDLLVLTREQQDAMTAVEFVIGDNLTRLERAAAEDEENEQPWLLVEPADFEADSELIERAINYVDTLRTAAFADDISAADAGLDSPQATATIHLGEEETITLLLGNPVEPDDESYNTNEDRQYAQLVGGPIVVIRARHAENYTMYPWDFRPPEVLEVERELVERVVITDAPAPVVEGEEPDAAVVMTLRRNRLDDDADEDAEHLWRMTEPEAINPVNMDVMRNLLTHVSHIEADRYVDHLTEAETGLDAPSRTLSFQLDDDVETEHFIEIGGPAEDGDGDTVAHYCRVDSGFSFVLETNDVSHLLLNAEAFLPPEEEEESDEEDGT